MRSTARLLVALACFVPALVPGEAARAAYPGANGHIAWTSNRTGNRDVWSMNPDGSDQRNLTANDAMDAFPAWSPDGSRIVFTSGRRERNWDLWTMDADGGNPTNLTPDAPAADWLPAWSPDGTRIAFTRNRDGDDADLWLMDADGSDRHPLTATNSPADDALPVWSPDGSRIAFRSNRAGNWEIYVVAVDGSAPPTDVTNDPAQDRAPSWSPNGTRIAFKSDRTGSFEIYTMAVDGSNLVRLTFDRTSDEYPTWSPEGDQVAFQSARAGNNEIYRMDADGTAVTRLTTDPAASPFVDFDPDWQSTLPGPGADLSVMIQDDPDPVQVQDRLTYRIAVANEGPEDAPAVTLTDALPPETSPGSAVASQGSCSGSTTVTCSLGTLPAGATATVTLTLTTVAAGDAFDVASVSSALSDPDPSDDAASASTTIVDETDQLSVHLTPTGFSPRNVPAPSLGTDVTWTVDSEGSHTVTDRSGMGAFDSGVLTTGEGYRVLLYASGGWLYRCRFHPKEEVGTIRVPMAISAQGGGAYVVRWAVADPPPGVVFDVQLKRPGLSFAPWQTGTTARSQAFSPDAGPGTYTFRAQLRNRSGDTLWSPIAAISVP